MRNTFRLVLIAAALCAAAVQAQELAFLRVDAAGDVTSLVLIYEDGGIYRAETTSSDEDYEALPDCLDPAYQANLEFISPYDFRRLKGEVPQSRVEATEVTTRAEELRAQKLKYNVHDLTVHHGGGSCFLAAETEHAGLTRFRALEIRSSFLNVFVADKEAAATLDWLRRTTALYSPPSGRVR